MTDPKASKQSSSPSGIGRREVLLSGTALAAAAALSAGGIGKTAQAQETKPEAATPPSGKKPNILVIWGDDIGVWNISFNNRGMMGYRTPNIDRIANEGLSFTDYYGQQSCTAGRAAFIGGNVPVRTGMTKVGLPGAKEGWQKSDVTVATVMKSLGYGTGQFGKNHQGDLDEHLPTMHGFDEFSATSITSTPRRSRSTRTIRKIPRSGRSSGRAG